MIRTHVWRLGEGRTLAWGLLFAALAAASLLFAKPAHADTFTVTNTVDPGDGTCSAVTGCTLREAIVAANDTASRDAVNFGIPGSGVRTISPVSELPQINRSGDHQWLHPARFQAERPADRRPRREHARGAQRIGRGIGGPISASNVVVRGLVINRFAANGINIRCATGARIEGNLIGVQRNGTSFLGDSSVGVEILTSNTSSPTASGPGCSF